MRKIKYGGHLEKGDFIGVAYTNFIVFGWYIGNGQGRSLQFYRFRIPKHAKENFEKYNKEPSPSPWMVKYLEKGFSLKTLNKDYLISPGIHRVFKATPLDIFTDQEDIKIYEESKKILIDLNFLEI